MERTPRRLPVLALAIAAGLCLGAPLAQAADEHGTQMNKMDHAAHKAADQQFLDKATTGNEKEVAAASLGVSKAQSSEVRDFATQLLRDHQDMLVKLDETSVALGVTPTRRYTAMNGWGSGVQDATAPHPAQDNIAASGSGAGDSNTGVNDRTGVDSDLTAAVGGDTGDNLANSSGSAVGQAGTAGRAATAAGGTQVAGSTVTGTGMMADSGMGHSGTMMGKQEIPASASQDPEVRKLADASGAQFDRQFVDKMVADHQKEIASFERAASDMSLSPEARQLASNALPTLRLHLATAQSLQAQRSAQ